MLGVLFHSHEVGKSTSQPLSAHATQNALPPNILMGFVTHYVAIYVGGRYVVV